MTQPDYPDGRRDRWDPGDQAHFEYHCYRGHNSRDARAWYRDRQPVTVLGIDQGGEYKEHPIPGSEFSTLNERLEAGMPMVYRVRFPDGYEHSAFEQELMTDPSHFWQEGPPGLDQIEQIRANDPEWAARLESHISMKRAVRKYARILSESQRSG